MFCFLHDISRHQWQNICSHVEENKDTIKPREHGNKSKLPHNTTEFEEIEAIKEFILNIGRVRGVPLPGRLPGLKDTDGYYLPVEDTRTIVYDLYRKAAEGDGRIPVKYSTFNKFWNKLAPQVKMLTPSTDLCDTCQYHQRQVTNTGHLDEEKKLQRWEKAVAHVNAAKAEREYYNGQVEDAKVDDSISHVSFDYAQQIHYPYSCQEVGSAYFKTPRKCGIFGICQESPESKQINYLIDEADMVGKGANVVVSMLDHYLKEHWQPTPVLLFHADNCVGQNKNNTMLQYLMWHLLTTETQDIEISFMISGHTKFAPDRHFGLLKKKYRAAEKVDTMHDVQRIVKESSPAGHNEAQCIRDPGTDEIYVKWYDWSKFFKDSFKHIPLITKYHHFRLSKAMPGQVRCSFAPDGEEHVLQIMKNLTVDSSLHPKEIHPDGLSRIRQQYLHHQITPLCSSLLAASISCPDPSE